MALNETDMQIRDLVADRLAAVPAGRESAAATLSALAELGVLAVPLPETMGGTGEGIGNAALLLEPLGQHASATPYLETICVPSAIAGFYPAFAPLSAALGSSAGGGKGAVMAWMEQGRGWSRTPTLTTAVEKGGTWVVNGHKSLVRCADFAETFLVTAAVKGVPALFWLPAATSGVSLTHYRSADGRTLTDIQLDDVVLEADCRIDDGDAQAAIDYGLDAGAALSTCEAVGLMDRCLDMTVDYLKTREQFGGPLSRMQALQHRLVEMYADVECAWSLAHGAACCLSPEMPAARRQATVSKAKAYVGRKGRQVALEALQMHGAIGMTKEYPLGRYLQRLTSIDRDYGDSQWHLDRLERALRGDCA